MGRALRAARGPRHLVGRAERGRHRGHRAPDVEALQRQRGGGRGRGQHLEGDLGQHAQRAARAGHQPREVVAGDVLHDAPARSHHAPLAVHEARADQAVAAGARAHAPRPRGAGGDRAADRGLPVRAHQRAVVHGLEGQALAVLGQGRLDLGHRRARGGHQRQRAGLVERDPRQPRGREDRGAVPVRRRARAPAADPERPRRPAHRLGERRLVAGLDHLAHRAGSVAGAIVGASSDRATTGAACAIAGPCARRLDRGSRGRPPTRVTGATAWAGASAPESLRVRAHPLPGSAILRRTPKRRPRRAPSPRRRHSRHCGRCRRSGRGPRSGWCGATPMPRGGTPWRG